MAGHSQFKNIMHRKGAQDKRRAKVLTKLIRELTRPGTPTPQKSTGALRRTYGVQRTNQQMRFLLLQNAASRILIRLQ